MEGRDDELDLDRQHVLPPRSWAPGPICLPIISPAST